MANHSQIERTPECKAQFAADMRNIELSAEVARLLAEVKRWQDDSMSLSHQIVAETAKVIACEDESRRLRASHERLLASLRELLASPNITTCPHGAWSTADDENYRIVRRAEAAIAQAEEEEGK